LSKTLAQADSYIANIFGASGDTSVKAQARDALGAAMEIMQHRNDWAFLRLDTSQSFTVVSSASGITTTLTTAVTDGFKNVLVGMTVTHANIPASTTVSAKASNTSLTLSASTTGSISAEAVTFGGTIPIIASTDSYTLPYKFWKPYTCRLITNVKQPLRFVQHSFWDQVTYDQTLTGSVFAYTIYTPVQFDSNGTQQSKIKFFRVPAANDTALLKYYRQFDLTDDPVDIPDPYLYLLLDLAGIQLLLRKNSTDSRLPALMRDVEMRMIRAIDTDRREGGEDEYESIHTPDELLARGGFSGEFWPRGDYGAGW
jgi:hypothetical protein